MVKNVNFILLGRTWKPHASRGQTDYTERSEASGYKQRGDNSSELEAFKLIFKKFCVNKQELTFAIAQILKKKK